MRNFNTLKGLSNTFNLAFILPVPTDKQNKILYNSLFNNKPERILASADLLKTIRVNVDKF